MYTPPKLTWIPQNHGLENVTPFKYGNFWLNFWVYVIMLTSTVLISALASWERVVVIIPWYNPPKKRYPKQPTSSPFFHFSNMGVSVNGGFSRQIIHLIIGFSIINHPFWGTTIFGNTHMLLLFANPGYEFHANRLRLQVFGLRFRWWCYTGTPRHLGSNRMIWRGVQPRG